MKKMIRQISQLLLVVLLSGCTIFGASQVAQLDNLYGEVKVRHRIATGKAAQASYIDKVKPVLDNRCVVCHACYNAACQLKLSSPAGIDRGSSKDRVYNASIFTRRPSRLFIDAENTEG